MMSCSEWSEESFTLRSVVDKGLPNVVYVCGGYLSDSHEESSFAQGDQLHLHSVREITYIEASSSTVTKACKDGARELIPLEYRGRVKIVEEVGKTYHSVQEVMDALPRFVKTKSIVVTDDENECVSIIPKGVRIEILENCLDRALKCGFRNKIVLAGVKQFASFELMQDDNEYQLKDIILRRKTPIDVIFLEMSKRDEILSNDINDCVTNYKEFRGRYTLHATVKKRVLIGHIKHSAPKKGSSVSYEKRTVFVLPYDSDAMTELEVREPNYVAKTYGNPLISNFQVFDSDPNSVYGNVLFLFQTSAPKHESHNTSVLHKSEDRDDKKKDSPPEKPERKKKLVEGVDTLGGADETYVELQDVGGHIQASDQTYVRMKNREDQQRSRDYVRSRSLPCIPSNNITDEGAPSSSRRKSLGKLGSFKQKLSSLTLFTPKARKASSESSPYSPSEYEPKFSSQELVRRLRLHGFHKEAAICQDQKLDDCFFLTSTVQQLCDILGLSSLEVYKIIKVCQGWLPKQTSEVTAEVFIENTKL